MKHMLCPSNTTNAIHGCPQPELDAKSTSVSPERGAMEIGKVNLILIGLIVMILFALILKDESGSAAYSQTNRVQTQIAAVAAPEAKAETAEATGQPSAPTEQAAQAEVESPATPKNDASKAESSPAEHKSNSKKTQKHDAPVVAGSGPVVHKQISQAQTPAQMQPATEQVAPKDPPTKVLVFNIWSVSELRLRSAYAAFLNDSAVPAAQLEARKKEYLNFVVQRAHKCGELDNRFAGNINTVDRLSFNKGDVDVLECHATENNNELDKLNALKARSVSFNG